MLARVPRVIQYALRAVRLLLLSIGALVVISLATPLTAWYARLLSKPWQNPDGDVLIILAADSEGDVMGRGTYLRCVYAVRAFRAGSFHRVVVSGGGDAPLMRDYLIFHGVPELIISVESRSTSTRENALFTRDLLAGTALRPVVLTSDYHALRTRRAFHRVGFDVVVAPFPDALKYSQRLVGRVPALVYEATETGKIAYYFVRGWI